LQWWIVNCDCPPFLPSLPNNSSIPLKLIHRSNSLISVISLLWLIVICCPPPSLPSFPNNYLLHFMSFSLPFQFLSSPLSLGNG
jgi:hypothetical protein